MGRVLIAKAISTSPGVPSMPPRDRNSVSVWPYFSLEKPGMGVQGIGEAVGPELKPHDSQSSALQVLSFSYHRQGGVAYVNPGA